MGGGSTSGGLVAEIDCAEGNECFEGSLDAVALDVTMKEAGDFRLRQSIAGGFDGFADAVGDGIAGGHAEKKGGTVVAIVPYGEVGLEMRQADDGGGVEGGVDGAEAQDLCLGTAGGGSAQAGPELAQDRIAVVPEFAGSSITAEENFRSRRGPVESVAEFAGDWGKIAGAEASTVGKAAAATRPGPETAIGKTILGFGAAEILSELTLRNVGDETDMSSVARRRCCT